MAFLLGFAGELRSGLNGDSAWLLLVAGRVLDGSMLYVDVVEVNPPLVVWLNLPVVAVARLLGVTEIATYRALVWGLALLALVLGFRQLERIRPPIAIARARALLLAAAVLLLAMPGGYYGQREHVALMLVLPWLYLIGARVEGAVTPRLESALIGALAAIGVGLKPHFFIVPLAVLAYAWRHAPRETRRPAPDLVAMAAVLLLYGIAVVTLAPEYFGLVRRLGPVYWDYLRRPLGTILAGDLRPLTVLWSLLYWPLARRLSAHRRLVDVLGLATAGFMAAVVLQHKGFGYHYYPAIATGLLLVILGLLGGGARMPAVAFRVAAQGVGVMVLLPVVVLFLGWAVSRAAGASRLGPVAEGPREIGAYLDTRPSPGPVAVWSPWMDDSFPLVLDRGLVWGSRYPFVWFLPALYRDQLAAGRPVRCHPEAEMAPEERELIGTVARDLQVWRPELVFVRKLNNEGLLRTPILACFSQLRAFRREFGAYRPVVDLEHFRVFQRGT